MKNNIICKRVKSKVNLNTKRGFHFLNENKVVSGQNCHLLSSLDVRDDME
jgi:hypothetical protein